MGRLAARRAGAGRIVHTYHGFPFHEFQSPARRGAYVALERRLGRITDLALCVGNGVAVEAVRRGLIPPDRIRAIGVAVDAPLAVAADRERAQARPQAAWPARTRNGGGGGRAAGLPEGAGGLSCRPARAAPSRRGRRLGGRGRARRAGGPAWPPRSRTLRCCSPGSATTCPRCCPPSTCSRCPAGTRACPRPWSRPCCAGCRWSRRRSTRSAILVVPGETGLLVPPRRPDLLAGAIRSLLDSPADAARMAVAARARLGTRYTVAALRDALEAAYAAADSNDTDGSRLVA